MSGEMRWQDWITAILGVILFITPFVFGDLCQTASCFRIGGTFGGTAAGGWALRRP